MKEFAQTQRAASTHVRRYMGQRTPLTDAHSARTLRHRHHQLNLSGFGSLNGFGFVRFLGLALGFGFEGPGMGNCFGLGCRLRQASPTISITSTVPTRRNGVMQNHQRDLISTWPKNSAAENFVNTDPISDRASRRHPFWCPGNPPPVIPPFLRGLGRRIYAAIVSFWTGVIPPLPMFGRSWL